MRKSKHTVEGVIRGARPEDVFDHLTSVEHIPEWMSHIKDARCDGDVGLGTVVTCTAHWLGKDFTMHQEVTEFERPTRYAASCDEPVPTGFEVELTETPDGTHVTVQGTCVTGGLPGAGMIAAKVMKHNLETMMRSLHRDLGDRIAS